MCEQHAKLSPCVKNTPEIFLEYELGAKGLPESEYHADDFFMREHHAKDFREREYHAKYFYEREHHAKDFHVHEYHAKDSPELEHLAIYFPDYFPECIKSSCAETSL